jgi:hypothetical protein
MRTMAMWPGDSDREEPNRTGIRALQPETAMLPVPHIRRLQNERYLLLAHVSEGNRCFSWLCITVTPLVVLM